MAADPESVQHSDSFPRTAVLPPGDSPLPRGGDRLLLNAMPLAMLIVDQSGHCIDANQSALALLGRPLELVVGTPISSYFDNLGELGDEHIPADGAAALGVGEASLLRDGEPSQLVALSIASIGAGPNRLQAYFFRDISDEVALTEQLRASALTDHLTGLPNRHSLEKQVDLSLRNISRGAPPSVLCFIDLDNFKVVNDACGHAAGDALLCMIAEVFQQRTRATDAVGRVGGDEFAVVLNACRLDDALDYVSELRDRIQSLDFSWDGRVFQVGVSAGITLLTARTVSVAAALAEADAACYAAKSAGRSQTHVYSERLRGPGAGLNADAETARSLRQALDADAILLSAQELRVLQPRRALEPAREVLLRMADANGQMIPPSQLLPVAARFGLAQRLDRWVIQRTIGWLNGLGRKRPAGRLFVNLTSASVAGKEVVDVIAAALDDKSARHFGIELSEAGVLSNVESASRLIEAVHALGCRVAIDRISGRAEALELLAGLGVDLLKLGPEFARGRQDDDPASIHAAALIRIADKFGMAVAATGIETKETIIRLQRLGAEYGQGVAIAHAAPLIPPSHGIGDSEHGTHQ